MGKQPTVFEDGTFYGNNLELTSLEGAPTEIVGPVKTAFFCCYCNKLPSLQYAPVKVDGSFDCSVNLLTSLKYSPTSVGEGCRCDNNMLTSLVGSPTSVGGGFYCGNNMLTSLEGAPTVVGRGFYCGSNQLVSLAGAPTEVGGDFECEENKLTSLEGIHKQIEKINGKFYAPDNKLESHLLGLILIDGITRIEIDNKDIEEILNRHLQQTNKKLAMLQCQQELIDADFEEAAQL